MRENLHLAPCPDSPNCVSSQSHNPEQYIEPYSYSGSITHARLKLRSLLEQHPRTHIISDLDTYLHAEVVSFLFRFVDDVEFLFDDEQKLIHVRSASRTGYWDMGVNRKRLESLRSQFLK